MRPQIISQDNLSSWEQSRNPATDRKYKHKVSRPWTQVRSLVAKGIHEIKHEPRGKALCAGFPQSPGQHKGPWLRGRVWPQGTGPCRLCPCLHIEEFLLIKDKVYSVFLMLKSLLLESYFKIRNYLESQKIKKNLIKSHLCFCLFLLQFKWFFKYF